MCQRCLAKEITYLFYFITYSNITNDLRIHPSLIKLRRIIVLVGVDDKQNKNVNIPTIVIVDDYL